MQVVFYVWVYEKKDIDKGSSHTEKFWHENKEFLCIEVKVYASSNWQDIQPK